MSGKNIAVKKPAFNLFKTAERVRYCLHGLFVKENPRFIFPNGIQYPPPL